MIIERIGIFTTYHWKKVLLLITGLIVFSPLLLIGFGYFIFDRDCQIIVNNSSNSIYKIKIFSDSDVLVEKDILPMKDSQSIIRINRWQKLTIKVYNKKDKKTIFLSCFDNNVFERLEQDYFFSKRKPYIVNIPEDEYLDRIK